MKTVSSTCPGASLWLVILALEYVLNYQIITSEGAPVGSTVTYLLLVVAIVLGATPLVLGETITVTVLADIALLLIGVALTRRRTRPTSSERQVE